MSDTREQLADRLAALSPEQRALLAHKLQQQQGAGAAGPAGAAPAPAPATVAVDHGIAIVSAACRLPGGVRSPAQFWQMLLAGVDAVGEVPPDRWDGAALFSTDPDDAQRMNSRWGGFLDGIDRFDAAFFGISPKEAALMDPQQRLLLETAWEALESGAQVVDRLAGSATGVFIGAHTHSNDYRLLQLAQAAGLEAHASTGSAHSILANRISYLLDLRGPSMCVDTACSSSLVAVHLACQSLRTGESDLALAGGVNLMLLPPASLEFAKLQILSPNGRCRSFDAAADGIARGEGCGLVLLKRLSDALRDGDPVLAVIRGSAVNQDGASNGLTAPNGPAQEAVVRRAFKLAGIEPQRLGLVETHGTGTALGDPVEVEALAKVIGAPRSAAQRCWLGAVKTNIGHLEGAAGIAGLIKAVLCLQHRRIPKNLHFQALNPHITLAGTALAIPTEAVDWQADGAARVAAVSSFGFGGTNAHVVIEEHVAAPAVPFEVPALSRLLAISARDANALHELARAHLEQLEALPAMDTTALASHVHSAACGRTQHAWRLGVVGDTAPAMARALRDRQGDAHGPGRAAAAGVVFVYSGQGGHWPGAGRELYATEPAFRDALDDVAARFERLSGWSPVPDLVEAGAARAARLLATEVAQPVLFALQVALTAQWRALGLTPAAVVGHSVGEVAAAWAAGVLSLDDAVSVVWHRSRLMQAAAGAGRMAQVDLPAAQVAAALLHHGEGLEIAGFNGPASTVVAGEPALLEAWVEEQGRNGVTARKLAVDYAFHSRQMARFCAPLVQALGAITPRSATLPLVSTVSGAWVAPDDYGRAYWARNIREPVRFAQAADTLLAAGYHAYLEVGPHPALGAGLHASAAAVGAGVEVAASLRRDRPARTALLGSLATLYEAGAAIDWHAQSAVGVRWVALPTYPWQRERHWLAAPDAQALARHVFGNAPMPAAGGRATAAYELTWEPMAPAARVDVGALATEIDRAATVAPSAALLAADVNATRALEERAVAHAWWAVRDLGVAGTAGERIDEARAVALGVATRHGRLWSSMLDRLGQAGLLSRAETAGVGAGAEVGAEQGAEQGADTAAGPAWHVTGSAPPARPASLDRPSPGAAPLRIEQLLLDRCGARLADVLRGRTDPLSLLFPNDPSLPSAATMYAAASTAVLCNEMTAEAVAGAAAKLARPRLRVVEIGGGTGAATAVTVPRLPAGTHYTFTDLSAGFLDGARERFAAGALEFDFRTLDIEQPPADQGFAPGQADVVVASNIVHATGDLRQTLAHIRWLLAPGGVLVMLETVTSRFWQTLTFGLTSGWWRFRDADLRTTGPVLPTGRWLTLLREAGYDAAAAAITATTAESLHPQALVLARASAAPLPGTRWLLLADDAGVAATLAERLRAEGAQCDVIAAARVAREGEAALPSPGPQWYGVVHCGALDALATGARPAKAGPAPQLDALLGAQALVRWIAACASPPRLWIVTRGAQRVLAGDKVRTPEQAPLWALGRSMALEMPAAWGGLVDLGADEVAPQGVAQAAEALLQELALRGEDQVACRGTASWCARLDVAEPLPAGRPVLTSEGSYLVTGGMGSLGARFARWLAARGARHIVLTSRSGTASDATGLQALESHLRSADPGVSLQCVRVDTTDVEATRSLFDTLRVEGRPVHGVVHAAAAFDFAPLATRTDAAWHEALAAKVQGAWLLHELTRNAPTDLFVLCSSITALLGAKGLSAYAAGNEFLGALAEMRRGLGLAATCVDWGTWAEPRAQLRNRRGDVASLGFADLDEAFAFEQLDRMVANGKARQAIAAIDWTVATTAYAVAGVRPMLARLAEMARRESAVAPAMRASSVPLQSGTEASSAGERNPAASPSSAQAELVQALRALPPQDRAAHLAAIVRHELTRVLGMGQAKQIAGDTGFFALGLDSLMAVQLRRRLGARTGLELGTTVTFNHSSVDALAAHLLARLLDEGTVAPAPQAALPARTGAAERPALAKKGAVEDTDVQALLRAELEALPADLRDDLQAGVPVR